MNTRAYLLAITYISAVRNVWLVLRATNYYIIYNTYMEELKIFQDKNLLNMSSNPRLKGNELKGETSSPNLERSSTIHYR